MTNSGERCYNIFFIQRTRKFSTPTIEIQFEGDKCAFVDFASQKGKTDL